MAKMVKVATKLTLASGATYWSMQQGIWGTAEQGSEAGKRLTKVIAPTASEYFDKVPSVLDLNESAIKNWNEGVKTVFKTVSRVPEMAEEYTSKASTAVSGLVGKEWRGDRASDPKPHEDGKTVSKQENREVTSDTVKSESAGTLAVPGALVATKIAQGLKETYTIFRNRHKSVPPSAEVPVDTTAKNKKVTPSTHHVVKENNSTIKVISSAPAPLVPSEHRKFKGQQEKSVSPDRQTVPEWKLRNKMNLTAEERINELKRNKAKSMIDHTTVLHESFNKPKKNPDPYAQYSHYRNRKFSSNNSNKATSQKITEPLIESSRVEDSSHDANSTLARESSYAKTSMPKFTTKMESKNDNHEIIGRGDRKANNTAFAKSSLGKPALTNSKTTKKQKPVTRKKGSASPARNVSRPRVSRPQAAKSPVPPSQGNNVIVITPVPQKPEHSQQTNLLAQDIPRSPKTSSAHQVSSVPVKVPSDPKQDKMVKPPSPAKTNVSTAVEEHETIGHPNIADQPVTAQEPIKPARQLSARLAQYSPNRKSELLSKSANPLGARQPFVNPKSEAEVGMTSPSHSRLARLRAQLGITTANSRVAEVEASMPRRPPSSIQKEPEPNPNPTDASKLKPSNSQTFGKNSNLRYSKWKPPTDPLVSGSSQNLAGEMEYGTAIPSRPVSKDIRL